MVENGHELRVLVASPSAYLLGGLATWLDYLLPGLRQSGWDVTLGLVSGPRYHHPREYLREHPSGQTVSIACGGGTDFDRISAIRRAIRKTQPDLVLSVNVPHAMWAVGIERAETGRDVRAVMSCHGIQADLFGDMAWLNSVLDGVVCTNKLACQLAVELGQISKSRVAHAACGVCSDDVERSRHADDPLTIAWVGRLEQPQKRVHDLVKIAEELRKRGAAFRILIAGDGPEREALASRLEECGLSQQVELLGRIATEDLNEQVYQRCQVLLLTSQWETGPIVIWEAMAQGCTVVTSKYVGSGLEGALSDGDNCLMFEVGDCLRACEQLERVAYGRELRDQLASSGQQLVRERFSHEFSIDCWDEVLRSICDAPQLPASPLFVDSVSTQGRLESWLGQRAASQLRTISGRKPPDSGPAGEWPHTIAGDPVDPETFWRLAERLDRKSSQFDSQPMAAQC